MIVGKGGAGVARSLATGLRVPDREREIDAPVGFRDVDGSGRQQE